MAVGNRKHKAPEMDTPKRGVKRARSEAASETASDSTLEYVDLKAAVDDDSPEVPPGVTSAAAPTTSVPGEAGSASEEDAAPSPSTNDSDITTSVDVPVPAATGNDPGKDTPPVTAAPTNALAPAPAIVDVSHINFLPGEVEYVPDDLIPRLISILNFTDTAANRYALGLLPPSATWGPVGDGKGMDKYFCFDNRPVTLWMLGVVTSVWLTPTEGSRVNVGIRLLTQRDKDTALRLQYNECDPKGDPSKAGHSTYAYRFLSNRGEHSPTSFEDVFDASNKLEGWNTMERISCDRVRKTDVVLVECYFRRFKQRENGPNYGWANWRVNFELLRIAHLLRGPGPMEHVPEESTISL